jgi:flavin-dependent dehydrogenase
MKDRRPHFDHDVIILGSGPAGTSTAIRLAALGFNVGLVERKQFPRAHPGICLSNPTLALLGFLAPHENLLRADFWRRKLTAVKWGSPEASYVEKNGVHIDRGALDLSLLKIALKNGVSAYQPASLVNTPATHEDGWRIVISIDGRCRELKARFLVDAAGRSPVLQDIRQKDSPPLVALHAKWELNEPPDFDGFIEDGDNAWLWFARTSARSAAISVFCAPQSIRERGEEDLQTCYLRLLSMFHLLRPSALGRQTSHLQVCDATSRHSTTPASDRHIRVGDACMSVDPLSSQGVHLALLSGIQAAIIINTILKKPENAELAKCFFSRRIEEKVALHTHRTRAEYRRVSEVRPGRFWRERAGHGSTAADPPAQLSTALPSPHPNTLLQIAPEVVFTKEPVIEGNFVANRPAIRHPGIKGAIAYVEGMNVRSLLSALPKEVSYQEIPNHWHGLVPSSLRKKLRSWFWEKRILVISCNP